MLDFQTKEEFKSVPLSQSLAWLTLVVLAVLFAGGVFNNGFREAEAATHGYQDTVKVPGGGTVHLSCMERTGALIVTTEVFSNQFGMTGGDVAVSASGACENRSPIKYAGPVTDGRGNVLAHQYCKGRALIAVTPIVTTQLGVAGSNVSIALQNGHCQ